MLSYFIPGSVLEVLRSFGRLLKITPEVRSREPVQRGHFRSGLFRCRLRHGEVQGESRFVSVVTLDLYKAKRVKTVYLSQSFLYGIHLCYCFRLYVYYFNFLLTWDKMMTSNVFNEETLLFKAHLTSIKLCV